MNKQLIKISVIVIGALVLLVLALYLMKKDQDRPGKRNSVETIGEAIADKTFTTKSEAYMAYANEKDEFYRRSAASFAPPPAVSKEPEAEKAAAAASAAPAVENRTQEIRFEQAYEEISRNVRSIYEEAPDDTRTVAREQPEVAKSPTSEQQIHPEFISRISIPASFKNPPSIPISPNSFSINTTCSPLYASERSFLIKVVFPAPRNPEIMSIFVIVLFSSFYYFKSNSTGQ